MSSKASSASVPSDNFLVLVVDVTSPSSASPSSSSSSGVLQSLAVFINSYLFLSRNHDVGLVAVGSERSDIAFRSARELTRGDRGGGKNEEGASVVSAAEVAVAFLLHAMNECSVPTLSSKEGNCVAMAKGLSQALCMINRRQQVRDTSGSRNSSSSSNSTGGGGRILVVQRASDQPDAYNAVMNAIFSAQKMSVLIDSLVLDNAAGSSSSSSSFLQQAAFLTGGIYLCPGVTSTSSTTTTTTVPSISRGAAGAAAPLSSDALTSLLLSHCLSDSDTRTVLKTPPLRSLDFRAACSCHGVPVDLAHMCSVCLSLQCEATDACGTCGTPVAKA